MRAGSRNSDIEMPREAMHGPGQRPRSATDAYAMVGVASDYTMIPAIKYNITLRSIVHATFCAACAILTRLYTAGEVPE